MNNNSSNKSRNKSKNFKRFNIVLSIVISILLIALAYRVNIRFFNNTDDEENIEPITPVEPLILPLPTHGVINTHDHINDLSLLDNWLEAMRSSNVSATVMVGSPATTFLIPSEKPFDDYERNNNLIIKMAQDTNGEIIAFPTLNPNYEYNLERFKLYIHQGARGLNLWTGHHGSLRGPWGETSLYDELGPLNRTDMDPIYEYCQQNRIPIIWSSNLGIREIRDNLWSILDRFPDMIIKIPHFGICFRDYNLPFIERFLDNYTGLYTCFSWGHPDYVMEKFENISTVRNEAIREFFIKYQDRIMFGTDMVPTDNKRKTVDWMRKHTQAYYDVLEKEYYHVEILDFTPEGKDFIADYRGLNLSKSILEKVYYNNSIKFLNGKAWNESLDEPANVRAGINEIQNDTEYLSNHFMTKSGVESPFKDLPEATSLRINVLRAVSMIKRSHKIIQFWN